MGSAGWRRSLQLALAALWLLDAVLQYQTFMLSQGFPRMLVATAAGTRSWPPACQIMMGVAMAYMLILML
jgi:hypothetical protein